MKAAHPPTFEESRRSILDAVGEGSELTFVRGRGNIGDELIWAGTRQLLATRITRDILHTELPGVEGDTAVLTGGGAWCEPFHAVMPDALMLAEKRFRRVVLLPSTFDMRVPVVSQAISHSNAIIFARERESMRQIAGVCDARLAHDCAFFFDFDPYRRPGSGVLNAFRTDAESARQSVLPSDNEDISLTSGGLEEWLAKIAAAETIRTDRAHVMIAGAMLGKTVEYRPTTYHKVPAIAEFSLGSFPVYRQGISTHEETDGRFGFGGDHA